MLGRWCQPASRAVDLCQTRPVTDRRPDSTTVASTQVARFWPVVSSAVALALVGALAVIIVFREQNKPFEFELGWMGRLIDARSEFFTGVALLFNALGGGVIGILIVPIGVALALYLTRRRWAALYFLVASIAGAIIVQVLKGAVGRPRPTDILVAADFGSFPSGHSANAAVVAMTLGIILARWWVWAAGVLYTVAMMLSRTYLGAHWISDTVGGVLIGIGVAIIVWAPFAARLRHENRLPQVDRPAAP